MSYSANEIGSLFRKAGIGAGLHSGIAVDISRAGLWLLVHDLAGDEAVLEGISNIEPHGSMERTDSQNILIDPFCAVLDGLSVFDLAAASTKIFHARLQKIDNPLLLLGIAGIAATDYQLRITLEFSNKSSFTIGADGSITNDSSVPARGADAVLTCQQVELDPGKNPNASSTVGVKDDVLKQLLAFAAKTYVPATAASREKGAGAGLTDND
ncbi:MAG: DUF3726 domain-containing protein [Sneathiella sp.]